MEDIVEFRAIMEAQVERASKEFEPAEYEASWGRIQFTFNGEPLKLDDDYRLLLIEELTESTQSNVEYDSENDTYFLEFPKKFWEDEPEYVDEDEAESILEDFYLDFARGVFVMQLSRDAELSKYGDTLEQSFENDYTDEFELYKLQQAIENNNVKEFLINEGYEIRDV